MAFINSESFYRVDKISPNAWRIIEPYQPLISMFLICGSEKAVLVDTAFGIGDLNTQCSRLTDKPVTLFSTHAHPDHVFGNWQFDKAYLSPADKPVYNAMCTPENYLAPFSDPGFREFISSIAGVPVEQLETPSASDIHFCPTEDITDGDFIDLGDRKLEVMAVPGHTPGSLALIDRADKIAYTGDGINQYPWMFLEGCMSLEEYQDMLISSQKRLEAAEVTTIYHGHCGEEPMDVGEVTAQIGYLDDVISGRVVGEPFENDAGKGLVCHFDKFHLHYNPNNLKRGQQ